MTKKKSDTSNVSEYVGNNNHPHSSVYAEVENYFINGSGYLIYKNGDKQYTLCNGSIIIKKVIYKLNGSGEAETWFVIEGIDRNGHTLPLVMVPAAKFNSLNWITENWGPSLVVMPNQTVKATLATGILLSGANCPRERVCTHTGYIMKNGKPVNFMSASGPLIPSDIKAELDPSLKRYSMSEPSKDDNERFEAIKAALELLKAHEPEVTGPLFAYTFLAAIIPIARAIMGDIGFLFFLNAKSQSGKSTLAALSTSFFGYFEAHTPPTTFASTPNAIFELAYILKDVSAWIDDFNPQEKMKVMNLIFQMLARAAGDLSVRMRLDSNAKLKESHPPRCLFIVTGEFPPKIGQSAQARIFQVDVPYSRKDITAIRKAAKAGILSRSMSDYIVYIIDNFDKVKDIARKQYEEILSNTNELFGECRLSNQAALLCLSAYLFFDYAVRCKALTKGEAEKHYRAIEASIIYNARKKEEQLFQEDPCTLYISAIRDLLSSGRANVIDLCRKDLPDNLQSYDYSLKLGPERDGYIGWKDEKGYYLNTNASYAAVTAYYARQDMSFITNATTLWRQLRDSGYVIPDKNNTPCQNKKIGRETRRVLWFPRKVFDVQDE